MGVRSRPGWIVKQAVAACVPGSNDGGWGCPCIMTIIAGNVTSTMSLNPAHVANCVSWIRPARRAMGKKSSPCFDDRACLLAVSLISDGGGSKASHKPGASRPNGQSLEYCGGETRRWKLCHSTKVLGGSCRYPLSRYQRGKLEIINTATTRPRVGSGAQSENCVLARATLSCLSDVRSQVAVTKALKEGFVTQRPQGPRLRCATPATMTGGCTT